MIKQVEVCDLGVFKIDAENMEWIGGAANPVYYNKVMRYVQLKYQKRYLLAVAQRSGFSLRLS